MKKFLGTLMLVAMMAQVSGTAFAITPLSDIGGHKYKEAIDYLFVNKVISGYPDGTFKPNNQINRAELLKILVGGAGYQPSELVYKDCFPDVKSEWYAKFVCFAKEKGWVEGYKDGTFKPEQFTRKVEAIKMLLNSEGFPVADKALDASVYSDVDSTLWYGPYMFMVEAMKIVDIAGAKYGSMDFITRGEISNNLYRSMLILEQKVGSFDQVVVTKGMGVKDPVVDPVKEPVKDPVVVVKSFDVPALAVSSSNPKSILVKWTVPANTGDSALKKYIFESKVVGAADYTAMDYLVADYDAKVKADGGILFTSLPLTTYNFRVKAVNVNGQMSAYSEVATLVTAQPLEPAAPTVELVSQTFSSITLKVNLPTYSGDSSLDSIFSSFTNPNDGSGVGGSDSIDGNNIVGSKTFIFSLFPDKTKALQPTYEFSFWVNNKNGKVSEKTIVKYAGLSITPARPTISVKAVAINHIDFNVVPPTHTGNSPLKMYHFNLESSSNPNDNFVSGGSNSKSYFENDMKGVYTLGNMLSPNTTYTVSFWVENTDGQVSAKVTQIAKTSAN